MNEIICPYCGGEMELRCVATCDWEPPMRYYKCLNCDSNSPLQIGGTLEDVAGKARKWYKPMQKPLTLDEARRQIAVWIEFAHNNIIKSNIEPCLNTSEGRTSIRFVGWCYDQYCLLKKDYGKEWRCWVTKPTDEERAAAKWEE